jgi:TRAP-type C4-dicarboxylate transport system permease small subunit
MLRALSRLESGAILVLSLAALTIGTMQVVLRYVFNTGMPWTEGVFVMLTVWAMLLAGSRAARDGLHVRVDLVVHAVPAWLRNFFDLLALAVSWALSAYFAYCGYLYAHFVWSIDAVSEEASLPEWVIYLIVPVSMAGFCLHYAVRALGWRRGVHPFDRTDG